MPNLAQQGALLRALQIAPWPSLATLFVFATQTILPPPGAMGASREEGAQAMGEAPGEAPGGHGGALGGGPGVGPGGGPGEDHGGGRKPFLGTLY